MSASQSASMTAQQRQAAVQAQNAQARAAVLRAGVGMTQRIYSNQFNPANSNVLNIIPRNVGLIRGFWVQILATVNNPAGSPALKPTPMNLANLLSQVVFTDLSNYTRINTTGWHIAMLNSVKMNRPYGCAVTTDDPRGFGSNMPLQVVPANIAATTQAQLETWLYIPLAYSEDDLRGSVYANIINATMNLQLTINANLVSLFGSDATLSVFQCAAAGASAASLTSCTVNVYQDFIDQLPQGQGGAILPLVDLSRIYELKNTSVVGLSAGQDFPIPYSNFRDFLSTFVIFDNGGQNNPGTDLNYIALQSANFTNIFQVPPHLMGLKTRQKLGVDVPSGMYYLDSRKKPITTIQYGNMELIFNPSIVNAGAQLLVAYEAMGSVNTLIPAGSLPGG